jgi:hypothetical protein
MLARAGSWRPWTFKQIGPLARIELVNWLHSHGFQVPGFTARRPLKVIRLLPMSTPVLPLT